MHGELDATTMEKTQSRQRGEKKAKKRGKGEKVVTSNATWASTRAKMLGTERATKKKKKRS